MTTLQERSEASSVTDKLGDNYKKLTPLVRVLLLNMRGYKFEDEAKDRLKDLPAELSVRDVAQVGSTIEEEFSSKFVWFKELIDPEAEVLARIAEHANAEHDEQTVESVITYLSDPENSERADQILQRLGQLAASE